MALSSRLRGGLRLALGALTFAWTLGAVAQTADYPSRAVKVVVPFIAGSSPDVVMRIVGQKLAETWEQQVVIENRPGAAGIVGAQAVAGAEPNGYTLMYAINSVLCANPHLYPKLPYDPFKSFQPISLVVNLGYVLLARSGFPVTDLNGLFAMARAEPGKINYGSAGNGGGNHVSMVLLMDMAAINMTHIPSRDSTRSIATGETDVALVPYTTGAAMAKNGKNRALGVTLGRRLDALPDVPSISESVPGYVADAWHGLFAPAGTPANIVDKVSADVARVLKQPDVRKRLTDLGLDPIGSTPQEFANVVRADYDKWGRVISKANIKLE